MVNVTVTDINPVANNHEQKLGFSPINAKFNISPLVISYCK